MTDESGDMGGDLAKKIKNGPPCVRALANQAILSGQMFSYKELFIK